MLVDTTPIATTDRLLLRRPAPGDGAAVFAVHGDPATNRYNPTGPHPDLARSEATLRIWLDDWAERGIGYCTVSLRTDPEAVIGFTGTRLFELDGTPTLNLYYRYSPAAWGRGIAAEAARATLELAGELRPQTPVVALIDAANLPSRRLAESLGLRHSGVDDREGRGIYRFPGRPVA
ncbi:GNAT family N-acetyltransferase [Kitasatospora sp. NBC_01302]|uniref:GNAT family N-acetyltransferase n=1 Tax=Kitasatospora sp. NBC_01302 TaxID=2903575 RepID=UPI002E0DB4EF|nr:GNAT family N-acetyltransferase [Kitasatospora sp. NBC_01302]